MREKIVSMETARKEAGKKKQAADAGMPDRVSDIFGYLGQAQDTIGRIGDMLENTIADMGEILAPTGLRPEDFTLDKEYLVEGLTRELFEESYLPLGKAMHFCFSFSCWKEEEDTSYFLSVVATSELVVDDKGETCPSHIVSEEMMLTKVEGADYYYWSDEDNGWKKDAGQTDMLNSIIGNCESESRGLFAEALLNVKPDISAKTMRKRLNDARMLCSLSELLEADDLDHLVMEDWMVADNGWLTPVLFPADEKRSGFYITSKKGKYQVYAALDPDECVWALCDADFYREKRIFEDANPEAVKQFIIAAADHYTAESVTTLPVSRSAFLEVDCFADMNVRLTSRNRELTEREERNIAEMHSWVSELMQLGLDDEEEDDEV